MPKQQPTVGPDDEDERLLVIDLGGGIVRESKRTSPSFRESRCLCWAIRKTARGIGTR